jgi:hypothetical protein
MKTPIRTTPANTEASGSVKLGTRSISQVRSDRQSRVEAGGISIGRDELLQVNLIVIVVVLASSNRSLCRKGKFGPVARYGRLTGLELSS